MPDQPITSYKHESPLGSWRISLCTPDPRLAPLVASIWFGEGAVSYERDRILPSGQTQLLINLGPTQYRIEAGPPERRIPFRDVWFAGLQQSPIDAEAPHGNALLGIAFHAHGAYPWLGPELAEVREQVLPLADVLGNGVLALRERLLNTPALGERFALVQQWIMARMREQQAVHPAVLWSLRQLNASAGRTSVSRLAAETGYSRKHLAELFQRQVGMSPKALARVLRFQGAVTMLRQAQAVPWAQLAGQCGYYDQAHLSNEFRAIAGMAPGDFVRQQQPDGQSIVLK
jgi:AraC-like DNA-binding protein